MKYWIHKKYYIILHYIILLIHFLLYMFVCFLFLNPFMDSDKLCLPDISELTRDPDHNQILDNSTNVTKVVFFFFFFF